MGRQEDHILRVRDGFKSRGEQSNIAEFVGERKLNLGCGLAPEPVWNGWINADINPISSAKVLFDATLDWPFADETFDTVLALQVLHLFQGEELFQVVHNAGKSLKKGGHLIAFVPYGATGNPMQLSFWLESTPRLFDKRVYFTWPNPDMTTTGWDQGMPMVGWDTVRVENHGNHTLVFVMRRV